MFKSYRTQAEVALEEDLLFRRCRIGRDAARDIAQRVEAGHGFWDFEERKRAAQEAQAAATAKHDQVVGAQVHDGAAHRLLAGRLMSGEETPTLAA